MGKPTRDFPARSQAPAVALHLRQLKMRFDTPELQRLSAAQRKKSITHLACLLAQAVGIKTGEENDDDKC